MSAKLATVNKEQPAQTFGKKPLKKSIENEVESPTANEVEVPGLSNDNAGHHLVPDWSIFSAAKLHPVAGKVQMVLTMIGLAAGLYYAFMSVSVGAIEGLTESIFSYLTYGLIGTVLGYFSVWIIGAAIILSPAILLASVFM